MVIVNIIFEKRIIKMDFKQKVEIMRELINSEEFFVKLKTIRKAVLDIYEDITLHKYINYLFSTDKSNIDILDDILSLREFEDKFGCFSTDIPYEEGYQRHVIDCSWDLLLSDNPIDLIRDYKRIKDEEMNAIIEKEKLARKKYLDNEESKERELYEKLKQKYER